MGLMKGCKANRQKSCGIQGFLKFNNMTSNAFMLVLKRFLAVVSYSLDLTTGLEYWTVVFSSLLCYHSLCHNITQVHE